MQINISIFASVTSARCYQTLIQYSPVRSLYMNSLVVARTYYGAFYLKPVIQSAVGCISRETEGCIPKLDTARM